MDFVPGVAGEAATTSCPLATKRVSFGVITTWAAVDFDVLTKASLTTRVTGCTDAAGCLATGTTGTVATMVVGFTAGAGAGLSSTGAGAEVRLAATMGATSLALKGGVTGAGIAFLGSAAADLDGSATTTVSEACGAKLLPATNAPITTTAAAAMRVTLKKNGAMRDGRGLDS